MFRNGDYVNFYLRSKFYSIPKFISDLELIKMLKPEEILNSGDGLKD